jgi:hypothetical protein
MCLVIEHDLRSVAICVLRNSSVAILVISHATKANAPRCAQASVTANDAVVILAPQNAIIKQGMHARKRQSVNMQRNCSVPVKRTTWSLSVVKLR